MKTRLFTLFTVSLLMASCLVAQETKVDLASEIGKIADAFREKHKVPGLGISVGHQGKIVFAGGFGMSDLENAVRTTEDTVFRTASIAKPITAVGVMQLVEQGKIGLDDPIQKHCPEFPETDHSLTVRHLLCHQGGVRHYKFPGESSGKKHFRTIKQSLELFKDDDLLFEPGTKYSYTTYGYSLLGRAIETASGMSYREYLQKNVFDVADMDSAGLDDYFRIIPNRTRGYSLVTRGTIMRTPEELKSLFKVGQVVNCELHDTSMKVPGGGIICSPTDLVKLGQAMLADQLMKAETRAISWQAQKTSDGAATSYGLGWGVTAGNNMKTIRHSGGQAGTSTMLVIVPEKDLVVAVMCNLQSTPASQLAQEIVDLVLKQVAN